MKKDHSVAATSEGPSGPALVLRYARRSAVGGEIL